MTETVRKRDGAPAPAGQGAPLRGGPAPPSPDDAAPGGTAGSFADRLRAGMSFRKMQQATIVLLLLILCAYASLRSDTFWSWANIVDNLLKNAAALGVIALGMTFVMIGGGFDLSVASTTAVSSVVLVLVMDGLSPHGAAVAVPAALAATALAGVALGSVNGLLVAYVGVNPFVVTLSTMLIFRGLALILTRGGQALQVGDIGLRNAFSWVYDARFRIFGGAGQVFTIALVAMGLFALWRTVRRFTRFGRVSTPRAKAALAAGGATLTLLVYGLLRLVFGPKSMVSMPIVVFVVMFAAGTYLLKYTRFGHYVFALGGNEQAAWLAGVNTRMIKAVTYAMCGLTCAVASVIFVSMTATAQAESHQGKELDVIASVIVGGTPLGGGSGGLGLTLTGVLLLRIIDNLLTQFAVGAEYRKILAGLIIVVVVTIDVLARRRGRA